MAKLFANLDKLKEQPTPNIVSAAKPINYAAQSKDIKTQFATSISLADRLKQPNLKTTNHLPQFFLSDNYTGFLKIQPFGVYQHKSLTVVNQPPATVAQGGTDSTQAVTSVSTRQGIVVINGIESSLINLTTPATGNQGTVESNNVVTSITKTQTPAATVSQGIIVLNNKETSVIDVTALGPTPNQGTIDITKPNPIINQGIGSDPVQPIIDVKNLQGVLGTGNTGIVVIPSKDIQKPLPSENPNWLNADQRITFNKNNGTKEKANAAPILRVLQYEGDRLLARISPTIKHGSTLQQTPTIQVKDSLMFDPSLAPTQAYLGGAGTNDPKSREERLSFIKDVLDSDIRSESENPILETLLGKSYPPGIKTSKTTHEYGTEFDPNNTDYINKNTPAIITALGFELKGDNDPNIDVAGIAFNSGRVLPKMPTSYTRINKDKQLVSPKNWVLVSYKDGALVEDTIDSYTNLATLINNKKNNETHYREKETTIKISRLTEGGESVYFTAFITTLSDTTSPTYQDAQPVGRQDTTKTFKGVTRQISLGFKAVALGAEKGVAWSVSDDFAGSKQNALQLVRKVNKLQQIAGIGTVQPDAAYTLGPTLAISVAGLYRNVICTANSVKVDVPIADTPWEFDAAPLPMYYDISMDFSVLTANDGGAFNTDKTFIGY